MIYLNFGGVLFVLLNSQAAASCVVLSCCGRMVDLFTLLILFFFLPGESPLSLVLATWFA